MWLGTKILFPLFLLIVSPVFSVGASPPENDSPPEPSIYIEEKEYELSPPPVIREGRTMIPMRNFFEEIGAKVEWQDEERVSLAYPENPDTVERAESFQHQYSEENVSFESPAIIIDGRIYVPILPSAEKFGYDVTWDEDQHAVLLTESEEKPDYEESFIRVEADKAEIEKEEDNTKEGTGNFIWPLEGGRVTSPYGWRNGRLHEGVDIGANTGTPILASENGMVKYVGWEGGYGNSVVIKHGKYYTRYAHNSANLVSTGEVVEKGQVIAQVGSTGRSTGPHVHFEIRTGGKYGTTKNPIDYIG